MDKPSRYGFSRLTLSINHPPVVWVICVVLLALAIGSPLTATEATELRNLERRLEVSQCFEVTLTVGLVAG